MARPSPADNETAHVADSQRSFGLAVQKQALAQIAKGEVSACVSTPENDSSHSRAIVREIGERLQTSFKEDHELPAQFRAQIERLRQSEHEALDGTRPGRCVSNQIYEDKRTYLDQRCGSQGGDGKKGVSCRPLNPSSLGRSAAIVAR
ncbi:hypothetical protein CQ12_39985 [Bradyrhizobium jicamae]|uniref:Uncharacterized protein n=1 Tax=Bradyrhizobium jicamae TaxID=280332 RepID=A0A0R3LUA0_9BRAD|nr:hypothetical protein CQ12_39985 [Bradyrhizobium jicamae]